MPERFLLHPQMIRMSTGHMEGTLQLLYVLLTDCYVYLLRKGARPPLPQAPHTPGVPQLPGMPPPFPKPPTPLVSLSCLACGDENTLHGRCCQQAQQPQDMSPGLLSIRTHVVLHHFRSRGPGGSPGERGQGLEDGQGREERPCG